MKLIRKYYQIIIYGLNNMAILIEKKTMLHYSTNITSNYIINKGAIGKLSINNAYNTNKYVELFTFNLLRQWSYQRLQWSYFANRFWVCK